MSHAVLELLRQRKESGSRPGHRCDPHRVVLAIEGGGSRATYASGMAAAIHELGFMPCFDAVYGSSLGAWIGAWLLSGNAGLGLSSQWWSRDDIRRIISLRHVLRGRSIVDTEQAAMVCRDLVPTIFEEVLANPVTLHPVATAVGSGEAADLAPYIHCERTLQLALRASAALPVLTGPPVELGRQRWLDGGIAESVPCATPIRGGATHLLVLRSRRSGLPSRHVSRLEERVVSRYLRKHAPPILPGWQGRHQRPAGSESAIDEGKIPGRDIHVLQLRPPPDSPPIGLTQVNVRLLRHAITVGRLCAYGQFGYGET